MRLLITMIVCYAFTYALNILVTKFKEYKKEKEKINQAIFDGYIKNVDTDFWEDLEKDDISTNRNN